MIDGLPVSDDPPPSDDLPEHLVRDALEPIDAARLVDRDDAGHPPRILLLYGSLRARSYSRLVAEECARLLEHLGCEATLYDPRGLPLVDSVEPDHPKVAELRELAVLEVSGGSQSFNAVNQMRVLGRWMRMVVIPNQSSVPKAFAEFDEAGRMLPSARYERIVDVMEELVKFTYLVRGRSDYLVDRYSERVESAAALSARVNQRAL